MNPTEPPTQIGKYKILSELGRGGMGVVYRAEDKFIGREVAIKTLVDANPEMRQRFAIEARSGVLNHQNIVTVYDFGEHEGNPYIVMEFLHGQTLERIVKENHPLMLVEKLEIIRQVCEGLGYAHSRGVVHRDVKPANVVVLPNGFVKLVDFGIAQLESLSGHTIAGSVIGTYQYLSPERLKGEASDGRADIWGAGVVLYLLLTGTLPFPGEDISALHRVITDPYPPLGTLLSTAYPESLDNIMARALAKDPAQRYPTALEMAGDLEATRDAIRVSRVEDLLGQARSLFDKDELLRARPLLLDLQRLVPQNTAVRAMLRQLQERLTHQPELQSTGLAAHGVPTPAASLPATNLPSSPDRDVIAGEHATPAQDREAPVDTSQAAAMQEDERRRRIIEQIVVEIRAQAERGHEVRALELVQRSLERAPQNGALLALQAEIQTRIESAQVKSTRLDAAPVAPPLHRPAEIVSSPSAPPEESVAMETAMETPVVAPAAASFAVAEEPAMEPPANSMEAVAMEFAEPVPEPSVSLEEPLNAPVRSAPNEIALTETVLIEPASVQAPLIEGAPALPDPVALTAPEPPPTDALSFESSPLVVSETTGEGVPAPEPSSTDERVAPFHEPVPAATELPESLVVRSATPSPSVEPTIAPPQAMPADTPRVSVTPQAPLHAANRTPSAAKAPPVPWLGRSGWIALGATVAGLLVICLLFALLHHRAPAPTPLTYAQIVASPYARVLHVKAASGESVPLPPGDQITPLRVDSLRPGSYTLDLQETGGKVDQAQCSIDPQQHLCLVSVAPLSDADVQAILNGGTRP